jgi:hypothetical protein
MPVRLSAALRYCGVEYPQPGGLTDEVMRVTCPVCKTEQSFAQARFTSDGKKISRYRCVRDCQELVIVRAQPGGGYARDGKVGYFIRVPAKNGLCEDGTRPEEQPKI